MPDRGQYQYTYDPTTGYLETRSIIVNGNTHTEQFAYDMLGRITSYTDAQNRKWGYEYKNAGIEGGVSYGRRVIETTPDKLKRVYEYNNRKDLVKVTESDTLPGVITPPRITAITYDKRHLPKIVTGPDGTVVSMDYRPDGKKLSETSGAWATLYDYDPVTGELSSITRTKTDENGTITSHSESFRTEYDTQGNKTIEVRGASPHTGLEAISTVLQYDAWGRVTSRTNALTETSSRTFTPSGRLLTEQTATGGFLSYGYDPISGRLSNVGKTGEESVTVTYAADGSITSKTDRNNFVTSYEYTDTGLVKEEITRAGKKVYAYDRAGRVKRQDTYTTSDNTNTITSYTTWDYNDTNRTVTVTEGGLYPTIWTMNAWGEPVSRTDAEGNTYRWEYTGAGKVSKAYDAYNRATSYTWNELGKVSRIDFPDDSFQEYTYDHLGNVLEIRDALGVSWMGIYNASGLLATETGRPGINKSYTYDELGRVESISSGGEIVERYTYENRGRTVTRIDGKNASFVYQKDAYGVLSSERNRLNGTKSYQYDDEGVLTDIIDYSGKAVTITSDAEERSHTTSYADGQTVTLQRDYAGRIVKAVSSTGVIGYEYDQGGKLITQTDEGAREEIRYTYNSAGRRTRMTGANRDVLYTYGNNGELLTVRDYGQGLSVSYTYDAMGREVSRQYGNGGRQDTLYDEAGRTIMVRELSARGEILRAEGYVYDSMGRRSATVDERGRVTLYRYDGQSRLLVVLYPTSEALVASDEAEAQKSGTRFNGSFSLGERIFLEGDEYSACANRLEEMGYGMSRLLTSAHNQWRQAFTYDANGNRLTKTTSWGTIVYVYDGENRLLGAGTLRYAYDADGNLLSETSPYGTKTYCYSGNNRMKESRVTDLEAKTEVLTSYAYDAFGRRTLVADDGGDTSREYTRLRTMYDGLSFEVFREGVAYADSSFASATSRSVPGAATGSTNGRYVYIDDEADGRSSFVSNDSVRRIAVRYSGESSPLYASGNRVAVNRSGNETTRGGRAYFGTDILGSVRSASGDDSVLEDRYEYDAFGVPYEGDFSSGTGAGYTGKPYDPITGLANYGYRDYSPVTARFTTVDPIRDGSNWFAYVNNDPVNYVDEWGLSASDRNSAKDARELEIAAAKQNGEWKLTHPFQEEFTKNGKPYPHAGNDYGFFINGKDKTEGTPVYSKFSGTVSTVQNDPALGNVVRIKTPDGGQYNTMHYSSVVVERDQTINKGDLLGYAGTTGSVSTAPHLHEEIRYPAKPEGYADKDMIYRFGQYYIDPNTLE